MSDAFRYEKDADGIVTVTMDMTGSANLMNDEYHHAMASTVDRLEADRDGITGVILTSAKKTFFAGGDLTMLIQVTPETAPDFSAYLEETKAQLRRLELLGKPVVAAINGSALGGGLEIATACHHRVVIDDDRIKLGQPEVQLGLLPGAGGVTRLVRKLGLAAALPLLTQGTQLRPAKALKAGLVDELAADREEMLAKARAWIAANPEPKQPWDTPGHTVPDLKFGDPNGYQLLSAAPAVLKKTTHGTMPAPEKILAAAVEGAMVDFDTALKIEGRYMVELASGQIAKNLIGTFWFQLNEVTAGASRPDGFARHIVTKVGVLGAGMMGAGIAQVTAEAGIPVVLKDVTARAAQAGVAKISATLDRRVAKGRLSAERKAAILDRVTATATDDFVGCDLIIEAVFEDRELKGKVTVAAERAAEPTAVIASNTSTLPITGLAAAVSAPERFIGVHFFSPVDKMRLVEIIVGEKTTDETLAKAYDYVLAIGKLPIVVTDSRGFYTSRTFGTYTTEGITMLAEGLHPAKIENIAVRAGMKIGPLAVTDEITLTLPLKIRKQTLADLTESGNDGERGALADNAAYEVLETFVTELGRTGKSGGAGFYEYPADGRKHLWPELQARYTKSDVDVPEDDIRDRLLFIQALETVRCLESGVLSSSRDANIGSIFGFGFAPWSGGTLQFINHVGLREFVARADQLAQRYGDRFEPPQLLRNRAAEGVLF